MRLVGHLSHKAVDILFLYQFQELVATLEIGGIVPAEWDDEREYGSCCHSPDDAPEIFSLCEHEDTHHKTRQDDAYWSLGQRGATHAEDGKPGQLMFSLFPPTVEQIHGSHHEGGIHHIHTAVDSCTMYFESSQREDGCDEARLGILALGKEYKAADGHQYQRYSRRQTGCEFAYVSGKEREECDAPVEEWWFVRNIASIIDRQYPVAMLQHGVGNYSLARLSLGIEFGKPEERNQHHDSKDGDEP